MCLRLRVRISCNEVVAVRILYTVYSNGACMCKMKAAESLEQDESRDANREGKARKFCFHTRSAQSGARCQARLVQTQHEESFKTCQTDSQKTNPAGPKLSLGKQNHVTAACVTSVTNNIKKLSVVFAARWYRGDDGDILRRQYSSALTVKVIYEGLSGYDLMRSRCKWEKLLAHHHFQVIREVISIQSDILMITVSPVTPWQLI